MIAGQLAAAVDLRHGSFQRGAKAEAWVRANVAQPMAIDVLADLAHMGQSSFRLYFKTPVQYQKALRVHEARVMDAGSAGREVGYVSASQFSREYTRLFGSAPTRDIARLRRDGLPADGIAR